MKIRTTYSRLDINLLLLRYVVECDAVRVVVMTAVWRLEVSLFATLVVAVAVLSAAMDMLCVVCVAR